MSPQGVATALLLPPLGLCLLGFLAVVGVALLRRPAWRRAALALAAAAPLLVLLLATPYVAGRLSWSLSHGIVQAERAEAQAIIVLAAEAVRSAGGQEPGPLTLERIRAAAALARRTGLPLLVTGGRMEPGAPSLAVLMARSLAEDFGQSPRWIEDEAADTRGNAGLSVRMLRDHGITEAYVVTHAWHMRRTLEAFGREGFAASAWPVRVERPPSGQASDWVPRPDHLVMSWLVLREWAGRFVYTLRDGGAQASPGRQ